jgi:predicted amidohydrolase YtcJ
MLIRGAEIWQRGIGDVRIVEGRIASVGALELQTGETLIEAAGSLLLPGLHDHHIHLAALAVTQSSVACGPPDITDEAGLAAALNRPGSDWLRGIGYHESVAGVLTVHQLDEWLPHRPLRIQHRSGRMWFLNSLALEKLLQHSAPPPGLERDQAGYTGRLFDEDAWLRTAMGSVPPDFADVSAHLATLGITGVTDMSPANDPLMAAHFRSQQGAGHLKQSSLLAGSLPLAKFEFGGWLALGPAKLHLHEAALPDLDEVIRFVRQAHDQGRGVAVHCTTECELVYALSVLDSGGTQRGDRIEHAGITPDTALVEMKRLGLWAVSQPHFIAERGDQYAKAVEPRDLPLLYRLRSFLRAGVPLAGGSDAPFGAADPWAATAAAVSRTTGSGRVIGPDEALSPEEAVALFLADPHDLTRQRRIEAGARADLVLLDRPWQDARSRLSASDVRLTIAGGTIIHNRIDQTPV